MDFGGKRALVTGGASGIGLATVERLARAGATVALNDLAESPRAAEQIARLSASGLKVIAAPGNVAEPGGAERMVAAAVQALGGLDLLVNNAGTSVSRAPIDFADLDAMTEDFWQTMLATNLLGPFRCTHAAAAALKASRGAVVSTASVAGLGVRGSSLAYSASKAALINMTRSLARALAPAVRVNAVAPGLVDSPWIQDWPEARKQATRDITLLGKLATPDDIAEGICFLLGHGHITGQTLVIDGGQS
jgi:3-oxoacyl-[acyl-carrier protein] reductase